MSLFKRNESDPKKIFQVAIIAFVIVEMISFILSQLGIMDFIKGGFVIILFMLVILLTTLFGFGININQVKAKEIILMIVVLAILVLLFIFLPQAIPQLFSSIPGTEINYELRDFFTKTLGSVGSMMGTGVTN